MRRSVLTGLTVGLGSLLAPALARAQSNPAFPTKPVRFIVALGPGSGADTGTRFVAERMGKVTGQPAVVNGASNLLKEAFGDAGVHARSAVGVASLPMNSPIEVEMIVEVAD
jgi:hypothetical protein